MTEKFTFAPAKREGVGLFIGLAGGTGSGKTYTALRLARGIVGPEGRIAAVDTEGRRMSHYAGQFQFDVSDLLPPFRPEKFEDAAKAAEAAGYQALVVDSFSHEWAGDGGVLEWHDELKGDDEKQNMRAWIKPKGAHKAMVNSFLQRKIPILFCFRAEEKIRVAGNGKPEPLGWMPIGDQRFMFELTTMLTLSNEAPGRVNFKLPHKVQEQHRAFFPEGGFVTEAAGAALAAWAKGDNPAPVKKRTATDVVDGLIKRMDESATADAVTLILAEDTVKKQVLWLLENNKPEHKRLFDHANARRLALKQAPETVGGLL